MPQGKLKGSYSRADFERHLNSMPMPLDMLQSKGGPIRDGSKNYGTWLMVRDKAKFNKLYQEEAKVRSAVITS